MDELEVVLLGLAVVGVATWFGAPGLLVAVVREARASFDAGRLKRAEAFLREADAEIEGLKGANAAVSEERDRAMASVVLMTERCKKQNAEVAQARKERDAFAREVETAHQERDNAQSYAAPVERIAAMQREIDDRTRATAQARSDAAVHKNNADDWKRKLDDAVRSRDHWKARAEDARCSDADEGDVTRARAELARANMETRGLRDTVALLTARLKAEQ